MANRNPFDSSNYDLGVGDQYGFDRDTATDNLLRTVYSHTPTCTTCSAPGPQYRVMPNRPSLVTAELQSGVYMCRACRSKTTLSPNDYSFIEMQ
jgi:hypothetical protein